MSQIWFSFYSTLRKSDILCTKGDIIFARFPSVTFRPSRKFQKKFCSSITWWFGVNSTKYRLSPSCQGFLAKVLSNHIIECGTEKWSKIFRPSRDGRNLWRAENLSLHKQPKNPFSPGLDINFTSLRLKISFNLT